MTTVPEEAVKAEVQLDPNAVIAAVRECARITAPDVTDAEFEALRADNDPLYANTTRDMERAIRAYLSALPFLPVQGAVKKLESSAARQLALEEAAKIADAKAGEYEREAEATDAYVSESDIRLCRAIAVRLRGVAAAIRALSSDHAGAGKVEGDGSAAARDVLAERRRQVCAEGWTPEHDDTHTGGEMAGAAACYALYGATYNAPSHYPPRKVYAAVAEARRNAEKDMDTTRDAIRMAIGEPKAPKNWPWNAEWWKPSDRRRNLVKAAALILAEIERLDRKASEGGYNV